MRLLDLRSNRTFMELKLVKDTPFEPREPMF